MSAPVRSAPPRAGTLLVVLGLAAVVAGAVVLLLPAARQADVGWFGYAPPPSGDVDSLTVVNGARALGAGLVLAGLLLPAFGAGLWLARRRGASRASVVTLVLAGVVAMVTGAVVVTRTGSEMGVETGPPDWTLGDPGLVDRLRLGPVVLAPTQVGGAGLVGLGLVLVAFALGARRGGSHRQRRAEPGADTGGEQG